MKTKKPYFSLQWNDWSIAKPEREGDDPLTDRAWRNESFATLAGAEARGHEILMANRDSFGCVTVSRFEWTPLDDGEGGTFWDWEIAASDHLVASTDGIEWEEHTLA